MSADPSIRRVAVIGSGPAGLMAATVLSDLGYPIDLFEKRSALGRKLLVAGSSGLNLTNSLPVKLFAKKYVSLSAPDFFERWLPSFTPQDWLNFIEKRLGLKTFVGSSHRCFLGGDQDPESNSRPLHGKPEDMKASHFLRIWLDLLRTQKVVLHSQAECVDFESTPTNRVLHWRENDGDQQQGFDSIIFALGGGSWEESPPAWPEMFRRKQIGCSPFSSSNAGWEVDWKPAFLAEALRKPIKNIVLQTSRGSVSGDLLVTEYGWEGTPIYTLGVEGIASLDLKPGMTEEQIIRKISHGEKRSPLRLIQRHLNLCEASLALIYHQTPAEILSDLVRLVQRIKRFPIPLLKPRPLSEAISSQGGIHMSELSQNDLTPMMLTRHPGIFLCGEMLDWDAPTGGYLIQACVLQGYLAALSTKAHLQSIGTI